MEHTDLFIESSQSEKPELQRYWVDWESRGGSKSNSLFGVYAGSHPSRERPVLHCSTGNQQAEGAGKLTVLNFFVSGAKVAELVGECAKVCASEKVLRLCVDSELQDGLVAPIEIECPEEKVLIAQRAELNAVAGGKETRTVAEMSVKASWYSDEFSVLAHPYFRSLETRSAGFNTLLRAVLGVSFVAAMVVLAVLLKLEHFCILFPLLVGLSGLLLLMLIGFHLRRTCFRGTKREELLQLVDIGDGRKYADIYYAWNSHCVANLSTEIVCYRPINLFQLLTLVSTAIEATIHIN